MKIINESIYHKFHKSENKLSSLGVGKIDLIKKWLEKLTIESKENRCAVGEFKINDDLSINVKGSLSLPDNYRDLPSYIQFFAVDGFFNCSYCNMTSLRGCPKQVEGYYKCSYNQLTSLEYGPEYVGDGFLCDGNKIPEDEENEFRKKIKKS